MDLIVIPQALLLFYGGLVLTCGTVLGVIAGRRIGRWRGSPTPPSPDLLERRVAQLEAELEMSQADLRQLIEERAFMRELERKVLPERKPLTRLGRSAA